MVKMPYDSPDHNDLHHWLDLTWSTQTQQTRAIILTYLLLTEAIQCFLTTTRFIRLDANTFEFQRIWVTLTNGATIYYLDPAFKSASQPGINLASAMGFNSNAVMTAAGGRQQYPD